MRSTVHPVVLVTVLATLAAPARSQDAPDTVRARDDTRAQRLFGELMSPYCPGLTLANCPSPGADSLRRDIGARLEAGESPVAIEEDYVADWGEQYRGAPRARDWGLLLWFIPGAVLLAGGAGVGLWIRSLQRRSAAGAAGAPAAGAAPEVGPALRARLEEELREFGKSV